jgi:nucleotide-binding universal stress UspA family protein
VLTVPGKTTSLGSALLAYDGSPKSDEALFVACHLADQWKIPLVVVSVDERGHSAEHSLERAQEYLANRDVQAELISSEGAVAEAILKIADEYASELIIMGGYGRRWVPEVVLGSVVDEVLRTTSLPLLICR